MNMQEATQNLMRYLDASPTAFQATANARELFSNSGFTELDERESWRLEAGHGYYLVRNGSTIVAFRTGTRSPESYGFRIATAHTDSPSLKIKPGSEAVKEGALRMSVEVYGGPIYHTWVDRELALAGCVTLNIDGRTVKRLFTSNQPVAIIPNAAIHVNREINKGFAYNPQEHLKAVFSSTTEVDPPALSDFLADNLDVEPGDVLDYDIYLHDPTASAIAGLHGDLLVSGRLDNLAMCHAVIESLLRAEAAAHTQLAVLFDSEEIGSKTYQGANGSHLRDVIERITISIGDNEADSVFRTLAHSAMVSGDAAHGIHPSYAEKHDEHFKPSLNGGPVIKISAGQRYTSTAITAAVFEQICKSLSVPVQRIIARSDIPSGGTVGPEVSSRLGIPSLDIGHPIWAMHSVRETGGTSDHGYMIEAVKGFFDSDLDWSGNDR